jgi:hypothetical protein
MVGEFDELPPHALSAALAAQITDTILSLCIA